LAGFPSGLSLSAGLLSFASALPVELSAAGELAAAVPPAQLESIRVPRQLRTFASVVVPTPGAVLADEVLAAGSLAGWVDAGVFACAKARPHARTNTVVHNANFSMEVPPSLCVSNFYAPTETV